MITLVEALNFRCLRYVRQPLGPFHVLVGPNASGKTTFLDVVAFLGNLVGAGPSAAIDERTNDFRDLTWGRKGDRFELAVEARIPEDRRKKLPSNGSRFDTVRYEVALGPDRETGETGLLAENVLLKVSEEARGGQRKLQFPDPLPPAGTVLTSKRVKGTRRVVSKAEGGNDNFYSETLDKSGKGYFPSIKLGPTRSALADLPADKSRFPVATWLRDLLGRGVQNFVLNSMLLRKASPPGKGRAFRTDGSNLPWVIAELEADKERFNQWLDHVRQTALPDLDHVRTVERADDRHRYLLVRYRNGVEVPSWVISDGTLRLLALTIVPYLADFRGVCLIEEPENGIHPTAVEAVYQSLSSAYDAQVLVATHSPVILSLVNPEAVLCFAKSPEGATDIVRGSEHPALRDWRHVPDLSVLFASGVLG
jgi:predicted ATPase